MTQLMPFVASRSIAEAVIEIAEQHGTALVPEAYQVWYHYIVGDHSDIKAALEDAVTSGSVDDDVVAQIYEDFLSPRAMESGLTAIGNGLASEVTNMHTQLEFGVRGNTRFATHLRDSIRELSVSGTKEEVKAIARQLYKSNQSHLALTYEMGEQLHRTREQLEVLQKELDVYRKSAFTDHLTELPNRRYLDKALDNMVNEAKDEDQPMCLAMLDLDHFKNINDTWGHPVGDNILRRLGALLRQNVKGRDIAARVGGEEFIVVLPATKLEGAVAVSESIRTAFQELEWFRQGSGETIGTITLSMGVTQLRAGDDVEDLIARADRLLYEAKNNGRNQVVSGK